MPIPRLHPQQFGGQHYLARRSAQPMPDPGYSPWVAPHNQPDGPAAQPPTIGRASGRVSTINQPHRVEHYGGRDYVLPPAPHVPSVHNALSGRGQAPAKTSKTKTNGASKTKGAVAGKVPTIKNVGKS